MSSSRDYTVHGENGAAPRYGGTVVKTGGKLWKLAAAVCGLLAVALGVSVIVLAVRGTSRPSPLACPTTDGALGAAPSTPVDLSRTPWRRVDDHGHWRFSSATGDASICNTVAASVMGRGGAAVDGAIAGLVCVGAVHMHSSGVGGGFFMTVYNTSAREGDRLHWNVATFNARERAPLLATRDMFLNDTQATLTGGRAIAVPGEIRGFHEAWRRYGRLPWHDLFAPSIHLCEHGFKVTRSLAETIQRHYQHIVTEPSLRELLLKADNSSYQEGDVMRRPKLARTLARIAADGADAFYKGELATDILQDIAEIGGLVRTNDLQSYTAAWREAVNITIGNHTVFSPPPPSSGVVVQLILGVLQELRLDQSDFSSTPSWTRTYHRISEALKFAFSKRALLGDPDFFNIDEVVQVMGRSETLQQMASMIDDTTTHDASYYDATYVTPDDQGTSHLSILAPDGAVSVTSSINTAFGCKRRGMRTGIIFNNHMNDFSWPGTDLQDGYPPSPANYIQPGKRPMSSMSPTVVADGQGRPKFVLGASGGKNIISAVAQVLAQLLWNSPPSDVVYAARDPRVHHQLTPPVLYVEKLMDQDVVDGLRARGHEVKVVEKMAMLHGLQADCSWGPIQKEACILAVSDWRRGGEPQGV